MRLFVCLSVCLSACLPVRPRPRTYSIPVLLLLLLFLIMSSKVSLTEMFSSQVLHSNRFFSKANKFVLFCTELRFICTFFFGTSSAYVSLKEHSDRCCLRDGDWNGHAAERKKGTIGKTTISSFHDPTSTAMRLLWSHENVRSLVADF